MKIKNKIFFALVIFFAFSASYEYAQADAWWGKGYRPPAWVLSHGGTIINYTIAGANSPKKYKAMMFRDGKYVEVEFGRKATFDDAKNGTYTINFYKCSKSCLDHKNDKKTKIRSKDKLVASINVVARPGQTNNIVFNAANKTATLVGRSGGVVVNVFDKQRAQAKKLEGERYTYVTAQSKNYALNRMMFLSHVIDHEQFRTQNVESGIVSQFLAKE